MIKSVNIKLLKAKYAKYRATKKYWSFKNFLISVGLTRYELERIKQEVMCGNAEAMKIAAFIDDVRYEYLAELEDKLVYQYEHPSLKNCKNDKFVNFNCIQFVATKLQKELENYDSFKLGVMETKLPVLENKSGVSLLAQVKKQN